MSNQHENDVREHHEHMWLKQERILPDGFQYYYLICSICHEVRFPAAELQKIKDYSKDHLFVSIKDWVLLLLYVGEKIYAENPVNNYIAGITRFQKMLFLIFNELVPEYEIPTENPGFFGYKYGPYSARVDETIDFLIQYDYISVSGRKSSSKEKFYLTPKGLKKGGEVYSKLSRNQKIKLMEFRKYWDQKTTKALLKYVYGNPKYKEYLKKSLILKDVFPDTVLHRRRG